MDIMIQIISLCYETKVGQFFIFINDIEIMRQSIWTSNVNYVEVSLIPVN